MNMLFKKNIAILILCVGSMFYTSTVLATELSIQTYNTKEEPLADVIAYAIPTDKKRVAALYAEYIKKPKTVTIEQRDKIFKPHISVFQRGTKIIFPNNDTVKHHVYSFSKTKTFEIPLYSEAQPDPMTFDTAGTVTLGCNIHDWMMAHILIVDTPFYAISDQKGKLTLKDIPEGDYQLFLWHPKQKAFKSKPKAITISPKNKELSFNIALKASWRKNSQKIPKSSGY